MQLSIAATAYWGLTHSTPADTESMSSTTILFAGFGAAIACTVATMWVLAHLIRTHVSKASSAASRFTDGDFTSRLDEGSRSEFQPLNPSLNHMAEGLDLNISALELQSSEMLAILQSMSNAVIALDENQRILRVNNTALEMFGLADIDVRGRLLQEVIREPELHRASTTAIEEGIRYVEEIPFARGSKIAKLVAEPLLDGKGESIGLVLVMEDMTRLRQLEQIRTDFAANVSHELRTPITVINGYAEVLQEDPEPELLKKCSTTILRNTQRLSLIIEDLLALARLEDPDRVSMLEFETISVTSIVDAVISAAKDQTQDFGKGIEHDIPPDLCIVGTRPLLEQAIGNLVNNALKYGSSDRPVRIEAKATEAGMITIEVYDFGAGISHEHLDRIFERFYRVDLSRSRELGGTGLGLSIVKHIAVVLGGSVDVESTLGLGSVFSITLPAGVIEA